MKIEGPIWALGTMSGTSLDGVDAAMILTDGEQIFDLGPSAYRAYSEGERDILRAALGQWQGTKDTARASEVVEAAHAELMARFTGFELAGFHGQTLAHDPGGLGTHQAGNGALLAEVLDQPVAWDFRSADVGMGGHGAPLAPFYHFACARFIEVKDPIAFLNLGGVGNITFVDPSKLGPEAEGALLAFDTGPANAPINDLMASRLGKEFDEDGGFAKSGHASTDIVERFLSHSYFQRIPPKSLDRDSFGELPRWVEGLSDADAAATLMACAIGSVEKALQHMPMVPTQILVTGGGRKNGAMMAGLKDALPCQIINIDETGLNGDMLEAQAFAYLAVRVARKLPTSSPSTTGVPGLVGGGILSHPGDLRGMSKSGDASSNPSN